tara:strand:+ start:266 stop:787 length:522 start_codon:yes stop_codon:yes gene_type:complete
MAFKNKSGIKEIKINFDLMPLLMVLDSVPTFFFTPQVKKELLKSLAKTAKDNIRSGNFDNNTINESTLNIRRWRNRSSTKPLIETGKLLKSIRAVKDGIEMEDYGKYHLQKGGYKIKSNKFTKAWNIKAGTRVPRRNFLKSKKSKPMELSVKAKSEMYKKIQKHIKTPNKPMR